MIPLVIGGVVITKEVLIGLGILTAGASAYYGLESLKQDGGWASGYEEDIPDDWDIPLNGSRADTDYDYLPIPYFTFDDGFETWLEKIATKKNQSKKGSGGGGGNGGERPPNPTTIALTGAAANALYSWYLAQEIHKKSNPFNRDWFEDSTAIKQKDNNTTPDPIFPSSKEPIPISQVIIRIPTPPPQPDPDPDPNPNFDETQPDPIKKPPKFEFLTDPVIFERLGNFRSPTQTPITGLAIYNHPGNISNPIIPTWIENPKANTFKNYKLSYDYNAEIMTESNNNFNFFLDYLVNAYANNLEDKNIDIDKISTILFDNFTHNYNIHLFSGLSQMQKMAEAFKNISQNVCRTPLLYELPSSWKIEPVDPSYNKNNKERLNPLINEWVKPKPPNNVENSFKFPDKSFLNIEKTLELYGKWATYEGGSEAYENFKRKPPNERNIGEELDNFKIASFDDIYNQTENLSEIKKQSPQNIAPTNITDLLLFSLGTNYVKTGLHEFPNIGANQSPTFNEKYKTDLETYIHNLTVKIELADDATKPDLELELMVKQNQLKQLEDLINKQDKSSSKANAHGVEPGQIPIPNLASGLSYNTEEINKKIGHFPLDFEFWDFTQDDTGKVTEAENPTITQNKSIADGLGLLMTLTAGTAFLTNINNQLNTKQVPMLEQAKNYAQKAANCACIAAESLGTNTRPRAQCGPRQFNFTNPGSWGELLKAKNGCTIGSELQADVSIKKMLQDILFGVSLLKNAVFKPSSEFEAQIKNVGEMIEDPEAKKQFEEWLTTFEKNELNKDYPIKASVKKKDTTPPTTPPTT